MTHVVHTKVIEGLGNLNLLLCIEKSVGELLALTQGTLNNLKSGDIAQEIGYADIVTVWVARSGGVRILTGLDSSEAGVIGYSSNVSLPLHPPLWFFWVFTVTIGLAGGTVGLPIGLGFGTGTHCV